MSVRLEQIGGEEAPNFHYFYVLLLVSIISDVCLNAFHLFLRAIWVSMGVCVAAVAGVRFTHTWSKFFLSVAHLRLLTSICFPRSSDF